MVNLYLLHLLSETFETGFRSTDWYFNATKWQTFQKSIPWLVYFGIIEDDPTNQYEWKKRYCVDIVLHFLSSWINGIDWIVILNVNNPAFSGLNHLNIDTSFMFLTVSMLADGVVMVTLYFLFVHFHRLDICGPVCVLFVRPLNNGNPQNNQVKYRWDFLLAIVILYSGYSQSWFFPDCN